MRVLFWLWLAACGAAEPPMRATSPEAPSSAAADAKSAVSAASAEEAPDEAMTAARQVVWRGDLSLTVEDVAKAEAGVRELATGAGGFVERADVSPQGRRSHAELVVRVPAEAFDATMERVGALAVEVTQRAVQAEDVTAELVDLDARIRNQEALEQRLQELLGRTGSVAEALEVQRELARVRTDIDQARGRQKLVRRQVAMATITVRLERVPEAGPVEISRWSPVNQAVRAGEMLVEGLQILGTVFIWLVLAWIPLTLVAFSPLLLLRWLWRRRARDTSKPA